MALSCYYWKVTFLQNFCHAIKFLHVLSKIGHVTNIFGYSKKIVGVSISLSAKKFIIWPVIY